MELIYNFLLGPYFWPSLLFTKFWYIFLSPVLTGIVITIWVRKIRFLAYGVMGSLLIMTFTYIASSIFVACCFRMHIG